MVILLGISIHPYIDEAIKYWDTHSIRKTIPFQRSLRQPNTYTKSLEFIFHIALVCNFFLDLSFLHRDITHTTNFTKIGSEKHIKVQDIISSGPYKLKRYGKKVIE